MTKCTADKKSMMQVFSQKFQTIYIDAKESNVNHFFPFFMLLHNIHVKTPSIEDFPLQMIP